MIPPEASPPETDAPPGTPESPAPNDSVFGQLNGLLRELPGLLSDRFELLSLEMHRAAIALAQIVGLIVLIAVLGMTVWLALWGAVVAALVATGLALGWALTATLLVNLVAACWAGICIRKLLPRVSLPATRRHLTSRAP